MDFRSWFVFTGIPRDRRKRVRQYCGGGHEKGTGPVFASRLRGSDQVAFAYNRQGQIKQSTDQNGTVHQFEFDKLGRQTHDRVTTVGTGIDTTVLRLSTAYEVRGMKTELSSWNNASVTSGDIVNDCRFVYNNFSQLVTEYQEHGDTVDTSTTPTVQYGFADGSANTIRPTSLTYPNGRVIDYTYSSSGSIPDALSRIDSIQDGGTTVLAQYSYLGGSPPTPSLFGSGKGSGTFVVTDYTQPSIKWTMPTLDGSNDPDTGDIYTGFDRFGRVKDNRWYNYGTSTDVDRIKYGYDRNGNRSYRQNVVATANGANFDELYQNDLIDRLKRMDRGQLTALKDSITNDTFAQCWTLDETGNWTGFREDDTGDGTWNLEQTRTANTVNEITSITESVGPTWVTPEYDAAGNMIIMPSVADPTVAQTCTYDAWNRLVKVMQGSSTVSAYGYDAAKRRNIQLTFTAGILSETRHLYYTEPSTWQVVEERVGTSPDSANAERQFVWGRRYIDELVVRDRDTTGTVDERLYAMQDSNWNVTAVASGGGSVRERYVYSAYGVPEFTGGSFVASGSSSFEWETLFAGYLWETATKRYHVRHRVYVPTVGLWVQRDPIGTYVLPSLYSYCQLNPLSMMDTLGLVADGSAAQPGRRGGPPHPPFKTRCLMSDTCAQLSAKMAARQLQIEQHRQFDIDNPNPRWPGGRHAVEIAELTNGYARCWEYYSAKCAVPCPNPGLITLPVISPASIPIALLLAVGAAAIVACLLLPPCAAVLGPAVYAGAPIAALIAIVSSDNYGA